MVGPIDLHRHTYSQAGAQFGYAMTWTILFRWPLMAAIQEISARIGRVTGKGIVGNIRYPVPLLRLIVSLLLVANIINLGADLGACLWFRCSPVRRLMPLRSRLAGQAAWVASPV
jgi:hypothetical protein